MPRVLPVQGAKKMTQQELRDEIWSSLPPLRKRMVGRDNVNQLISAAIEQAPSEFADCIAQGSPEEKVFLAAWGRDVKKAFCVKCGDDVQFGPMFWILIGPIMQIVLERLLNWWFEGSSHRVLMAGWRREAE